MGRALVAAKRRPRHGQQSSQKAACAACLKAALQPLVEGAVGLQAAGGAGGSQKAGGDACGRSGRGVNPARALSELSSPLVAPCGLL